MIGENKSAKYKTLKMQNKFVIIIIIIRGSIVHAGPRLAEEFFINSFIFWQSILIPCKFLFISSFPPQIGPSCFYFSLPFSYQNYFNSVIIRPYLIWPAILNLLIKNVLLQAQLWILSPPLATVLFSSEKAFEFFYVPSIF